MPQLIPFFFTNQIVMSFVVFFTLFYVLSKYILPRIVSLQAIRLFITKL